MSRRAQLRIKSKRTRVRAASQAASKAIDSLAGLNFIDESVKDELVALLEGEIEAAVRAELSRHGIDIAEGEAIDEQTISRELGRKVGIELRDVTSLQTLYEDIDNWASAKLSEITGMEFENVVSAPELITQQLLAEIVRQIEGTSRSAVAFGKGHATTLKQAMAAVDWWGDDRGAQSNARRTQLRIAQKKYRRSHKLEWQ
jgi:hypothetical protein